MTSIIEKAKAKFSQMVNEFGSDPYQLLAHVPEMEKWAKYMLKKYPEADKEVVFLAVWLHDLGHYPVPTEIDHAIRSEQRAKEFLEKEKYSPDKTNMVLHCIRSHRCRDIMPNSIEAKVIACIDSASHMTGPMYLDIAKDDKQAKHAFRVYGKMERDYRDIAIFPEIQKELKQLYDAWKKLIKAYEQIDFD